jgi:hypothetical protein
MASYTMDMVFEYAKVFKENADMGDPNGNKINKDIAKKGGHTSVNAYFTSEEDMQKLIDDGLDLAPLGHPRIKDGNTEYGIGKFITFKRGVADDIRTFENKNGPVEVNFGGLPPVIDMRNGRENRRLWSYEEDGSIGNGSKGPLKFSMYSHGAGVRLDAIGVEELVEWEEFEPEEDIFAVGG